MGCKEKASAKVGGIHNVDYNVGIFLLNTGILGTVWLASQGLYTKVFIPLYRVLGLEENEFLSSILSENKCVSYPIYTILLMAAQDD